VVPAQLGLEVGDYIFEIERQPVAGPQTVVRTFLLRDSGESVVTGVMRNGQREVLRLPVH